MALLDEETQKRLRDLFKDAVPGKPVTIPRDLACEIDAQLDRLLGTSEQLPEIRRREHRGSGPLLTPRGHLRIDD